MERRTFMRLFSWDEAYAARSAVLHDVWFFRVFLKLRPWVENPRLEDAIWSAALLCGFFREMKRMPHGVRRSMMCGSPGYF